MRTTRPAARIRAFTPRFTSYAPIPILYRRPSPSASTRTARSPGPLYRAGAASRRRRYGAIVRRQGQEYLGELKRMCALRSAKECAASELREAFTGQTSGRIALLRIHLGQGLSRGERIDRAIQKATELGANEISHADRQPRQWWRCEVRLLKPLDRRTNAPTNG